MKIGTSRLTYPLILLLGVTLMVTSSCESLFDDGEPSKPIDETVQSEDVQKLLDNGTSILTILETIPIDSLYGKTYAGGLIFYVDAVTGKGYVAAPFDQSTDIEWGCKGTRLWIESASIGKGLANTNSIVAGCHTTGIAADVCLKLTLGEYSDWFMPSLDELVAMYWKIYKKGKGGFNETANGYYYSSTEHDSGSAWGIHFLNGSPTKLIKVTTLNSNCLRAARAF